MEKIKIKQFMFLLIGLLISFTASADAMDDLFIERLFERHHLSNDSGHNARLVDFSAVDERLVDLVKSEYDDLLAFADTFDLFELGFSYQVYEATYAFSSNDADKFYAFAIDIKKKGLSLTRRYYEVSIRVDGVPYVSRVVNYDFE